MRLRISVCLLLMAALWIVPPTVAAVAPNVISYRVGAALGLDLPFGGGMIVDKTGDIWFAARYTRANPTLPALCRFCPNEKKITTFKLPIGIREAGALAYDAPRNTIWVADSAGRKLARFQIIGRVLTVYNLPVHLGDMADIESISVDSRGRCFCALWLSDAIGVFDPAKLSLAVYPVPQTGVAPYSVSVEHNEAWFTSGPNPGGWMFGDLNVDTSEVAVWESSEGTDVNTFCLKAVERQEGSPPVEIDRVFMTALGTDQIGVFSTGPDAPTLSAYNLCSTDTLVYGLDLESYTDAVWASEPMRGNLARVSTYGSGVDVPLIGVAVAEVANTVVSVPPPWVYQLSMNTTSLRPSGDVVQPNICWDPSFVAEYKLGPIAIPGAVAFKYGWDGFEVWTADVYNDAIVKVGWGF